MERECILYTLQNTGMTYDEAMSALEEHFVPKVNTVVARHQFRRRAQCVHEMIALYITILH